MKKLFYAGAAAAAGGLLYLIGSIPVYYLNEPHQPEDMESIQRFNDHLVDEYCYKHHIHRNELTEEMWQKKVFPYIRKKGVVTFADLIFNRI